MHSLCALTIGKDKDLLLPNIKPIVKMIDEVRTKVASRKLVTGFKCGLFAFMQDIPDVSPFKYYSEPSCCAVIGWQLILQKCVWQPSLC